MLTPRLERTLKATVTRRRELPVKGKILAQVGQLVSPTTVVGRAELEGPCDIVRVAEELGIDAEEAVRAVRVTVGDSVKPGVLLAEHRGLFGLFSSRVFAPCSGTVEFITEETAHIGIRYPPEPIELSAYIAGTIESIEADKSVVVKADGALIQGVFGVGGEKSGRILPLPVSPDQIVEPADLPGQISGTVLVGGAGFSLAAIRAAASLGVVGIVTASIDDDVLSQYLGYEVGVAITGDENVPVTVIALEGFGKLPFDERSSALFETLRGQQASISGATQVRAGAVRPEIFVSGSFSNAQFADSAALELVVGARVKVIRVPYFGEPGVVSRLPHDLTRIGSGGLARVVEVKLKSGKSVVVPRANVELA